VSFDKTARCGVLKTKRNIVCCADHWGVGCKCIVDEWSLGLG